LIYRALIIGLGKIGMGYDFNLAPSKLIASHAQALDFHAGFELVGGVDVDAQSRKSFSEKFQKPTYPKSTTALDELRPDIITIAVPTKIHLVSLREILGEYTPKLILLEKPLSYDMSEAYEILGISTDVPIAVNYFREYEPKYRSVFSSISNGLLGFPLKVVIHYSKGILNNGSHFIRYISHLMGDFTKLKIIEEGPVCEKDDPEPDVHITFNHGTAFLIAHDEENYSHYEMEVIGPEGKIRFSDMGNIIEYWRVVNDPVFNGYSILSDCPAQFLPDTKKYQMHVYNNLYDYLEGRAELHCDAQSMGRTIDIYQSIKKELRNA